MKGVRGSSAGTRYFGAHTNSLVPSRELAGFLVAHGLLSEEGGSAGPHEAAPCPDYRAFRGRRILNLTRTSPSSFFIASSSTFGR